MEFKVLRKKLIEKGAGSPTIADEQLWLEEQVKVSAYKLPKGLIVECGTWKTATALLMANAVRATQERHPEREIEPRVISIDNYSFGDEHPERTDIKTFAENTALVKELGYDNILTLIEGDDIEVLRTLPDQSLSLLWVDSLHTKNHVYEILDVAFPKMMDHSMVCGHDYNYRKAGVIYALEDFCREKEGYITHPCLHHSIWWFIMRSSKVRKQSR